MVEAQEKHKTEEAKQLRCRVCEKHVDKLFQHNTCKSCLVKSFGKYIKMINESRGS